MSNLRGCSNMTTTAKPGVTETGEDVREVVRLKYGEAAKRAASGGSEKASCGCGCGEGGGDAITRDLYDAVTASSVPEKAVLASLGCGNPTAIDEIPVGATVLDLGSGAGIDCFLAAKMVGETGQVYGVDMTAAMIHKARTNVEDSGMANVEIREVQHRVHGGGAPYLGAHERGCFFAGRGFVAQGARHARCPNLCHTGLCKHPVHGPGPAKANGGLEKPSEDKTVYPAPALAGCECR